MFPSAARVRIEIKGANLGVNRKLKKRVKPRHRGQQSCNDSKYLLTLNTCEEIIHDWIGVFRSFLARRFPHIEGHSLWKPGYDRRCHFGFSIEKRSDFVTRLFLKVEMRIPKSANQRLNRLGEGVEGGGAHNLGYSWWFHRKIHGWISPRSHIQ